jgi:hypothetical protein
MIFCLSCQNKQKYPYAIKDFRDALQPHLISEVTKGIVMGFDSTISKMLTDKELFQLFQSEHPILRASAFREMVQRKSINHFDLLMNHLDDTAIVAVDQGEFGISFRTVSDDILQGATWKTQDSKNQTIDLVLTNHNYLQSAYRILTEIEAQKKYYANIRDMATRPRRLSYDGYELGFDDIEYALYGLAKFKRMDDISILKNRMMEHVWKLSNISFRLMKEFPDTAYLDVFQSYYRRQFYRFNGNRRDGFTGYYFERADPEDFSNALAEQQNEGSATLFDTLLNRLPLQTCMPDGKNIMEEVIMAIWEHPCPAYGRLREKIKTRVQEILKRNISLDVPVYPASVDTTKENFRW